MSAQYTLCDGHILRREHCTLCCSSASAEDRGFACLNLENFAVALAFEEQIVDSIPTTSNDVSMDILVLSSETIACSAAGKAALAKQ